MYGLIGKLTAVSGQRDSLTDAMLKARPQCRGACPTSSHTIPMITACREAGRPEALLSVTTAAPCPPL